MQEQLRPSALKDRVARFSGQKVAVIGDPVLDVYLYGTTHRISREAPVLIVREDGRESRLGGAANAAANLATLGARVEMIGLVGDDDEARELVVLMNAFGIRATRLVRSPTVRTVSKTRVLAGAVHTTKQQMLRIDRENDRPPPSDMVDAVIRRGLDALEEADALIVSDYGDGSLSQAYAAIASRASKMGRIVIVDSRAGLAMYGGVTAVTPNAPEAEAALSVRVSSDDEAVRAAATLRRKLNVGAVVLTRGREGMAIANASDDVFLIAAHGNTEAVDVTGAGDTVTSVVALALCSGASVIEASVLANLSASIAVQRVGAATVTRDELAAVIDEFAADRAIRCLPEKKRG